MEHTLRVPKEEQLQGPVPGGSDPFSSSLVRKISKKGEIFEEPGLAGCGLFNKNIL